MSTEKGKAAILSFPTIGSRVEFLMEARGLTQVAVADRAGLTQPTISNICANRRQKPNAQTVLKLATALQANPYWILAGQGSPFEVSAIGKDDERELLALYRGMSAEKRNVLLLAVRSIEQRTTAELRKLVSFISKAD